MEAYYYVKGNTTIEKMWHSIGKVHTVHVTDACIAVRMASHKSVKEYHGEWSLFCLVYKILILRSKALIDSEAVL